MDSKDHTMTNTQQSPGGKSHVCSKCGWNYPNPHPSAKNRRAHKKICGTIKGFEILKDHQNLDLHKEHCLDDEPKPPSPRVVEKADERIEDINEEDVFADAVSEFSSSLVKVKEETTANGMSKTATSPGETKQCNKGSEVVQESSDVPPIEALAKFPSSIESAFGENSSEAHSVVPESLIETSRDAHVINGGDTISNVGLETEHKENILWTESESESGLASASGKRKDTLDSSWNDEVIYSDVEGPHGFAFEEMSEAEYTSYVKANAAQATPSVPVAENVDISVHGTKGLEESELNRSVNTCFLGFSIGTEVPSPDTLPLEDKTEHQDQTCLIAVKELPSVENIVMPRIDLEDSKMKAESSLGACQETVELRTSLPAVDPIVADVDLIGPESEPIQVNVVAEENDTISEHISESSCAVQHYVTPMSVALDVSDQNTVTSKDSIFQLGSEACVSTDEDTTTPNHKLLESARTDFNKVVGGLGVIQANEMDCNIKAHNFYAEIPVTIESNDHRDFGRLQNLSEAHIRSLVSSPLVSRYNTSNAISGLSEGFNKPENETQSSSLSVALTKKQEITMEKTTSWSTAKEQHVPLKNLLSEARSPRLVAEEENNIQRVSSILEQEEEGGWPEKREVSEEWNTPAKYPVERKVKGRPFWVPFVCCSSAAK